MRPYAAPIEGRADKDYLLLDFNERTIPSHSLVLKEIEEYINKGNFQMYPEYGDLNKILAEYLRVERGEVLATVGGDQGIDIIVRAFVQDGDKVIIPSPTFAMFSQSANIQGANIISPRYKGEKFEFPFKEVLQAIKPGIKVIVLCKPNNPTGTPIKRAQSEAIIEKAAAFNIVVLADEAYHEFAPELTVIGLINKYPNLFIIRTFAKTLGIPALRAGVIASHRRNIEELIKIRGPYDVNMAAVLAMRALRYPEVVADINNYVSEVMHVSKPMVEAFYDDFGIKYYPSSAGFHLLKFENNNRRDNFVNFLKEHGVLVRPRSDPKNTVRVSMGVRKDTEKYIEVFKKYLRS